MSKRSLPGRILVMDLLAVGEALVVGILPSSGIGSSLPVGLAGAEVNLVMALRRAGHCTGLATRVGADPFGDFILGALEDEHLATFVERDPDAPTGFYLRTSGPGERNVHYFRRGSAGATLPRSGTLIDAVRQSRRLHLTGITAATDSRNPHLLSVLIGHARETGTTVSFDVNFREGLWSAAAAADPLLQLARSSDLVFTGLDEAIRLWGLASVEQLADLFDVGELVVKDSDTRLIHIFENRRHTTVRVDPVPVVDSVGAGDAFAAGYLHAAALGLDVSARALAGHLFAAEILTQSCDFLDAEAVARAMRAMERSL